MGKIKQRYDIKFPFTENNEEGLFLDLNNSVEDKDDRVSYYLNIIKYHSRYKEITDIDKKTAFLGYTVDNKGYIALEENDYIFNNESEYTNNETELYRKNKEYLYYLSFYRAFYVWRLFLHRHMRQAKRQCLK